MMKIMVFYVPGALSIEVGCPAEVGLPELVD